MAVRTGASFPLGRLRSADEHTQTRAMSMSDLLAWQLPIQVDIGAKVHPHFLVGGYIGFAYGHGASGGGGVYAGYPCDTTWNECAALDMRLGFQAQYHGNPDGWVNPWVGYGLGVESLRVHHVENSGACDDTGTATGLEFARVDMGLDVRLSRLLGAGAFVSSAAGDYLTASVDPVCAKSSGLATVLGRADGSIHLWLSVGARVVLLP
jgi:hypothetical protein